jgi:sporulation protein YlmC with PRC-barrel domain
MRLIALSALALLLAPAALAQDVAPIAPSSELARTGIVAPTVLSRGYVVTGADTLVTKLLDKTVYTSNADDAGEIGKIVDMVVTPSIGISAVVIGVGGFLGIGAKDVAVDFAELQWEQASDGTYRWVLPTTVEALTAAPAFIWADSEQTTGEPALTPDEEEAQLVDGNPNVTAIDPALTTDQPGRQAAGTAVDRTGFSAVDTAGLTTEQMLGIGVYGIDDQQIGTIAQVLENADGSVDAIVVDVGGFLGLGAKPVAVAYENLTFSTDTSDNRYLFINADRVQLEDQPAYDAATYAQQRDIQRMIVTP